LKRFEVPW